MHGCCTYEIVEISSQDIVMSGKDLKFKGGSDIGAVDKVLGSVTMESK